MQERSYALDLLRRSATRLLTLTGPSGVGKTRLALQLVQDLVPDCTDGVVYVPLAPIRAAAVVPSVIAQTFGIHEVAYSSPAEQVLDCASFVANLLASCPRLCVLVTSRTSLRVRAEQELPPASPPLEDAVTLFRERAQAVRPGRVYSVSEVAAICEQVDHLPLAIELAAMHVKVLSLAELRKRLTHRLSLLRELWLCCSYHNDSCDMLECILSTYLISKKRRYDMSSLHEELHQVPWTQLSHAYGPATDTPSQLLSLLSPEAEKREVALDRLWASICHQGSVYEASGEAALCLIQILQMIPDGQKPSILSLLGGLANSYRYENRDQLRLQMDHSGGESRQRWKSMRQFLQEGNNYHQPRWMERTHRLVGEGLPIYLSLLQLTDQDTVCETLNLLACFQELNHFIVPVVIKLFSETADPLIAASALTCLSTLLDASSTHWEHYYRAVNADPSQISPIVRLRAANALARYHSESIPPVAVDILVENMLQPLILDKLEDEDAEESEGESVKYYYDVDCRSLSCLGIPVGLRGLVSALEQGASRWSVRDTIRVAEALLDVAFFGCWVEGRYWTYRSKRRLDICLKAATITSSGRYNPGDGIFSPDESPDLDNDNAYFHLDYNGIGIRVSADGLVEYVSEYFIEVFGYDKIEALRLKYMYEREGSRALLAHQREALEAVLRCEVLWTFKHNLLEIYGLPTPREEVEHFLMVLNIN